MTPALTPEGCALSEGFEGLTDALAPARDESLGADVLGWTHTPPPGWSIDNSRMPAQGVTEWQGWSFTTMAFWETAAGGQDRGGFTTARGVFAVADPDEWDDRNTPSNEGFFDSTLVSPRVPVPAGHRMVLRFDNDYRHEDAQTAEVLYCYDGGPDRLLARYDASSGDVRNQQVALEIPAPDAASELVVKWRMYRAGNDWWWAIDNVVLCDPAAQAEQVDSDGDGLSDAEEARLHTDPHNADTDHDGLLDGEETGRHGTDPLAFDTDGDTGGDGEEIRIGTSPLDRDDFIRTPLGGAGALAALGAAGVAEACRRHPRGGRGSRAVE